MHETALNPPHTHTPLYTHTLNMLYPYISFMLFQTLGTQKKIFWRLFLPIQWKSVGFSVVLNPTDFHCMDTEILFNTYIYIFHRRNGDIGVSNWQIFHFCMNYPFHFNLTYSSNQVSPGAPGFLDHSHGFSVLAFRFALRLLRWSKGMEGGIEEAHRRERERDGIGISVVLMKWCCSSQKTYTRTYYQMVSAGGSSIPHLSFFFMLTFFTRLFKGLWTPNLFEP